MHPNISMLCEVARRLGPLGERVVFVGGATVPLFLTDPGAPAPRSTRDVDVIVQIASQVAYHRFSEELRERGFREDVESQVLCRWRANDLIVDVMPTEAQILGFSNRWYQDTLDTAELCEVSPTVSIRLARASHFIATKIEAFLGRGQGDFLGSRDMEDIITVLDGRAELVREIETSQPPLRTYLASQFALWLAESDFLEALSGHLLPDAASQARKSLLLKRLRDIAALK